MKKLRNIIKIMNLAINLFVLLLSITIHAQTIQTSNMVYNFPGEERFMYLNDYETSNLLLFDFGDGEEMISNKSNTPQERIVKHIYSKPGNYVVRVYELKGNKQVLITAENITIKNPPSNFRIKEVVVSKYNPVKPDGRAWDNMMGGTYPDIFISYYANKNLLNNGLVFNNVSPNLLPILVDRGRVFNLSKLPEFLSIAFYDYDSISGSDFMAGFDIDLDPIYLLENQKDGIKFSYQEFEGYLNFEIY